MREREIESFVGRVIMACQTGLIEELLNKHVFSVDDIYNLYPEFDALLLYPTRCVNCYKDVVCRDSETGVCESCFEANQMPKEIDEWWLVSPWFGKKLLLEKEPVIDNGYGVWWGRTTTGQAISLDHIIEKIYDDVVGNIK